MKSLTDRLSKAMKFEPEHFYATKTKIGLSRSNSWNAEAVADIANSRRQALDQALVECVELLIRLQITLRGNEEGRWINQTLAALDEALKGMGEK